MARYVFKRLLEIIPLVFLVSLICFALMQATPGGPTAMMSNNPMVRPEDTARIRANFGFDKPVIVQYGPSQPLVAGDRVDAGAVAVARQLAPTA
ncbi:MAG: hypothetical protein IH969_09740, partial [Candidatus Krumholzibacteriota bacterium]|nr:hypothetical protein [Candidatus Krumholzibacteriota bacterium]